MKLLLLLTLLALAPSVAFAGSICFGTTSNGRLEAGVALPASGNNYSAYSSLGVHLGRTYLHSKVSGIVVEAYSQLERTAPGKVFVYGETGWSGGGRLRPHRTHQNGTSVDFFVPVVDEEGRSVPLPTSALSKFGYDIEFDASGKYKEFTIDFEAIAEHLYQLHVAATKRGTPITLVILDPRYLPRLFQTKRGPHLKKALNFMRRDAWVRHDEHYHVDFGVKCKTAGA